jgi:hypothetical protein
VEFHNNQKGALLTNGLEVKIIGSLYHLVHEKKYITKKYIFS